MPKKQSFDQFVEKFWKRCRTEDVDACWKWTGAHDPRKGKGYGHVRFNRKVERTHRIAWILTHGSIPKNLHVCHRCDNPPCCNPRHLFLGTNLDNVNDKLSKGRQSFLKGELNGEAILTKDQVKEIRSIYIKRVGRQRVNGPTQTHLAHQYGVSRQTISALITGVTWEE